MTSRPSRPPIGLVPAAGRAARLSPLPCSKEIYPLGFRDAASDGGRRPKVAIHYLLERMRRAGVRRAYIVLRDGKWDIPAYLGDGALADMDLAYLVTRVPHGAPFTLDQAHPFVRDAEIAFGFPDILFEPADGFARLAARQAATGADLVLGLFPADRPEKVDMVELDDAGRVRAIVIKPGHTSLRYTWLIAWWTPVFTEFLHQRVREVRRAIEAAGSASQPELFVGDVVQAALDRGLRVEPVLFPDGAFVDIGTPEDLGRVVAGGLPPADPAAASLS